MKKFVSMLLVSAMLLTALTACDNNNDQSGTNSNSSSTTTGNESSTNESSTGESTSDNESSSSDDAIVIPDDPNNPPDEPGDDIVIDNSGLEFPDNKAGNVAKTILGIDEWPHMDIILPEYVSALLSPDFNTDSYEEYCFVSNVISAQLNKIVVIKPNEGKEEEVSNAIDAYFDAVQNDPNLAFYPMQQTSAEGAVKGKTDDGYYYLIVHANGADIESAMLAAI